MKDRSFIEIGRSAYVFILGNAREMVDPSSFSTEAGLEEAERHFTVISRRDESIERGIVGELEAEIVVDDGLVLWFE